MVPISPLFVGKVVAMSVCIGLPRIAKTDVLLYGIIEKTAFFVLVDLTILTTEGHSLTKKTVNVELIIVVRGNAADLRFRLEVLLNVMEAGLPMQCSHSSINREREQHHHFRHCAQWK